MPLEQYSPYWKYILMGACGIAAIVLGLAAQWLLLRAILLFFRKSDQDARNIIVRHLRWPLRFMVPLLFVAILMAALVGLAWLPQEMLTPSGRIFTTLFIFLFAWGIIKLISITVELAEHRTRKSRPDTVRTRKLFTQLHLIRRIASVILMFIAVSVILLQFEEIRNLGTTILASAGVIGIVVGVAAQRSIATLFAGFQIAISQPIHLDDRVVVENEWGVIEEITLTYVVVRIWDLRRLILPITHFIEKPFQNLTRNSSDMLGAVHLHVDYSVPVAAVREKLNELVHANPLWNGNVCVLQVTEALERDLVIRALVSAADAPSLWDLRCQVREALVTWLMAEHPDCLPRVRTSFDRDRPAVRPRRQPRAPRRRPSSRQG